MNKEKVIFSLLLAAILFQIGVLGNKYVKSVYPLWKGETVFLAIEPIDPRSLFRGHYARLNYKIGSVPRDLFRSGDLEQIRSGETVYVLLEEDKKEAVWSPVKASLDEPRNGTFIRGRAHRARIWRRNSGNISVRYGIEAYFLPKEEARKLENEMRWRSSPASSPGWSRYPAIAEVKIAPDGSAALVTVHADAASS